MAMYLSIYDSPLGPIRLVSNGDALVGLYLDTQEMPGMDFIQEDVPVFTQVRHWLDGYFCGKPTEIDFPLSPAGTEFQHRVWDILLTIPYGETTTYGTIARQLGEKMSAQAVGGAVGKNPISILIPCHRVVGSNGTLTGYAGGLDKKQWLLGHEEEHK